jgi:hypothetical protein
MRDANGTMPAAMLDSEIADTVGGENRADAGEIIVTTDHLAAYACPS